MSKTPQRKGRKKNTVVRARQLENASLALRLIDFHEFARMADFKKAEKAGSLPNRYFVRHFPHLTILETKGYKERYIFDRGAEYVLECKFQNCSGSCDEKGPLLWESFLVSPYANWIVWFEGKWWATPRGLAWVHWLRRQVAERPVNGRNFYICASDNEWVSLVRQLFQQAEAA